MSDFMHGTTDGTSHVSLRLFPNNVCLIDSACSCCIIIKIVNLGVKRYGRGLKLRVLGWKDVPVASKISAKIYKNIRNKRKGNYIIRDLGCCREILMSNIRRRFFIRHA